MNAPSKSPGKVSGKQAGPHRRTARLAAVQALYEMDMTGAPIDQVLREFKKKRWKGAVEENGDSGDLAIPNWGLFRRLVKGTVENTEELDPMIDSALSGGLTVKGLESLLKSILRAGVHELSDVGGDIPASVVISEYVDIAHAFFSGNETALVNGVLCHLATQLRPGEAVKSGR